MDIVSARQGRPWFLVAVATVWFPLLGGSGFLSEYAAAGRPLVRGFSFTHQSTLPSAVLCLCVVIHGQEPTISAGRSLVVIWDISFVDWQRSPPFGVLAVRVGTGERGAGGARPDSATANFAALPRT